MLSEQPPCVPLLHPTRLTLLTGAGMSAESGVPTFRDALTGLWAQHDPQRLATEEGFRNDPPLVWGWYRWRAAQVRRVAPHAGHLGVAALEAVGHIITVVTQNVDDLHERAGSSQVLHLHGHLLRSRCTECGHRQQPDPILPAADIDTLAQNREPPPQCPQCGDCFRPDVVWFGEALPEAPWQAAQQALRNSDIVVVIGTSGLVYPAASLPAAAKALGKPVIEINPVPSAITPIADMFWRLPASQGVAKLAAWLAQERPYPSPSADHCT